MASPINGAEGFPRLTSSIAPTFNDGAGDVGTLNFQNLLLEALGQTNAMEQSAQSAIAEKLAGSEITQIEVFSAVKKADLALRMMLQIRNKLLEAYNEIKNMQM